MKGMHCVPLYKGKEDICECNNSRGISLLSEVGKLNGRVLIVRIRTWTNGVLGEKRCGIRIGRGCTCRSSFCGEEEV